MLDYGRRLLIALLIALCISLLFIGGNRMQAAEKLPEGFIWPAEGVITDHFGTRGGAHKGIDIAAPINTKVIASKAGEVSRAYFSPSYGNVVFIRHDGQYETVYAHLNTILVKPGDSVKGGQAVGLMGTTGHSTGVHLHFEIHEANWTFSKENAIDPLIALNDAQTPVHAAVAVQKEDSNNSPQKIYRVKKGDTLWSVAVMAGTSVDELKGINNMRADKILIGQVLTLPR
ncbi:peptidoglycan DD-metalloendopeptidase family protein [Peribacillus sp. SCS-37]|uniref:peptidoglycan DD-metalloendopeptidase family protein n=1 Tax=Paraperibacillus esterisolvens TaxID=3115296 RepID=UPI00390683B0